MGLFNKKQQASVPVVSGDSEQAVILHFELSDRDFGSDREREAVYELETRLEAAIAKMGAGELDGNEFGGGEAVLYMYGQDKDRLWAAIESDVRQFPLRPAYALLRAGGPDVKAERVNL